MAKVDWADIPGLGATAKNKIVQLQMLDDALEKKKVVKTQGESKEDLFAFQCRARKLPPYVRQYHFAQVFKRRWSFDFCFHVLPGALATREIKLAVEIEGVTMRRAKDGTWQMGGRHATITGFKEDCEKYANAALLGWRLIRFEQSQVKSGYAVEMTTRILHSMGWKIQS